MIEKEPGKQCTVVVSSCDEYKDVWDACFKIMSIEWPDLAYPVVLLTEKEDYQSKDIDVDVFQAGRVMPWGNRLRLCLKNIDTKYVVLLLDDFYPLERVDQPRIEQCISWMNKNPNIAVFTFNSVPRENIRDGKFPGFEKRPRDGEYRFNCQPAVWRRERLIEFLKPKESPWDWEIIGSIRSRKYGDDFYSAIDDQPFIFTHQFAKYGLRQGKWGIATKDLFRKHGIEMDFSKRGFYDAGVEPKEQLKEQGFFEKIPRHVKWRMRQIRIKRETRRAQKYLDNK